MVHSVRHPSSPRSWAPLPPSPPSPRNVPAPHTTLSADTPKLEVSWRDEVPLFAEGPSRGEQLASLTPGALRCPLIGTHHLLLEIPVYLLPESFLSSHSMSNLVACISPLCIPPLPTSSWNCPRRDVGLISSEEKKKSVQDLEGSMEINPERRSNWCEVSHRWAEELRLPGSLH